VKCLLGLCLLFDVVGPLLGGVFIDLVSGVKWCNSFASINFVVSVCCTCYVWAVLFYVHDTSLFSVWLV